MNLDDLQARQLELQQNSVDLLARADGEKRDPSGDEQVELDGIIAEMSSNDANIGRLKKLESLGANLNASVGRKAQPEPVASMRDDEDDDVDQAPARMSGKQAHHSKPAHISFSRETGRWGWRSFGEFSQKVKEAAMHGSTLDGRLVAKMAPTTYGTENVGSDGGFAVPPDFRSDIMQKVQGEDSLLSLTDQFTTSSNSITFPKDETTPWQTSGGVLAYWEGEASAMTQSKPALQQETVKLNKMTCLVPVSDELIEDAPALTTYLKRKVGDKMTFKSNLAIVQGDGVGKPLGILNAGSTVQVGKETSQAADTIVAMNIFKMYSRLYAPLVKSAVWLVNQDVLPQLYALTVPVKNVAGTENVGGSVVYTPANGVSQAPYGTLMGRPIFVTQACETIGDAGDILFFDPKSYMTATKTSGPTADTSIHLFFDYNVTAFRFIWRLAGKPWWSEDIDARDGSNAMSWAVKLEAR